MKTNSIYSLVFLAAASFLVNSCGSIWDCIDGNGNPESEQRLVTEFSGVENTTSFNVEVIYDSVYSVEVTADDNILQLINTSVRGDKLIIDTDNNMCINFGSSVDVEIHMPVLNSIELSGSGNMNIFDFDCESLEIENSGSGNIDMTGIYATTTVDIRVDGSGDVSISGKAHRGDYTVSGSGNIDAEDLLVDECYAYISGSGNIHCFAYLLLDATIDGSGDIIYGGSPDEVVQTINGSGRIREIN
jgi:hypothetical protein